jgi:excisionase family DNA binding protein
MSTTKSHPSDERLVIIEQCATQLDERGDTVLADQVRVLAQTIARDTVSVSEAASLAGVSHQTIKNWIGRGIVRSMQVRKGAHHRVDRESLMYTIQRRAEVDAARAAFQSPEAAVEFISGLDEATLDRLGGL